MSYTLFHKPIVSGSRLDLQYSIQINNLLFHSINPLIMSLIFFVAFRFEASVGILKKCNCSARRLQTLPCGLLTSKRIFGCRDIDLEKQEAQRRPATSMGNFRRTARSFCFTITSVPSIFGSFLLTKK